MNDGVNGALLLLLMLGIFGDEACELFVAAYFAFRDDVSRAQLHEFC